MPIDGPSSADSPENILIRNRRSLAMSRMPAELYCVAYEALYPNVKILHEERRISSASQGGQKYLWSLSWDQVPTDVPPKPWTKIRSRCGSGGRRQGLVQVGFRPALVVDWPAVVNWTQLTVVRRFADQDESKEPTETV